jgi:hypothetical protein
MLRAGAYISCHMLASGASMMVSTFNDRSTSANLTAVIIA